jgi:hypothetical protein
MAIFDSIPFTRADLATSWQSSCIVTPRLWRGGDVIGLCDTTAPSVEG